MALTVMPNVSMHVDNTCKSKHSRSDKVKKDASAKEMLCLQTKEIVTDHIQGITQGHQYSAVRRYCLKVVKENEATFLQLCKKLKPSRESLHSNFMRVLGNLFSEGISIGKIVTSIAFGGKLVEYCSESGLDVTENIIAWTLDYFKHYISEWILTYGGWVR